MRFRGSKKAVRTTRGMTFKRARLEALEERRLLALVPELVADINVATTDSFFGSNSLVKLRDDVVYFLAHGRELWRTDGSADETEMAVDLSFGEAGQVNAHNLTTMGDRLLFNRNNALWISDGSAAGTKLVSSQAILDLSSQRGAFPIIEGALYFAGGPAGLDVELWRTDGTETGTYLVKDIYEGSGQSRPGQIVKTNDMLFFSASDTVHGRALWRSDGTLEGTGFVHDFASALGPTTIRDTVATTDAVFVSTSVQDGQSTVREYWKSDGTAAGTMHLSSIHPLLDGDVSGSMMSAGDFIYVAISRTGTPLGLVRTNGSPEGTVFLAHLGEVTESLSAGDSLFSMARCT